jgi:rhodanese-related sulfurtransferase
LPIAEEIDMKTAQDPALAHREAPIVLVCRSGGCSALAADALRALGFAEHLSPVGGFSRGQGGRARDWRLRSH